MSGDVVIHQHGPRRVVLAMPLPPTALEHLVASLGAESELLDITDADGTEDIVVTPSVSRQLIGRLRDAFPTARLLVVELEDQAHDVHYGGHVTRSLAWGADGYYVASSVDQLAAFLGERPPAAPPPVPAALPTAAEQQVSEIIDVIIRNRTTKSPATAPQVGHDTADG